MRRGKLITFEGGEGAGKTTLIEGIYGHLISQKHTAFKTREPGGTPLSEKVRSLLLENGQEKISPFAELALFLASRAQHIEDVLLPALEEGEIVLCDRFNDSSVAYQGIARALGKDEVAHACAFFSQNLEPDLTFFLDIEPSLGLSRAQKIKEQDRIEKEGFSFHTKVRNAFLEIAKENPKRIHVLDATLSKEKILEEALQCLKI